MTRVVEVPASFDDRTFDQFVKSYGNPEPGERLLFDCHGAHFASPYGLVGLLAAGQAATEKGLEQPKLTVPNDKDVARYWSRLGFFKYAEEMFDIHGTVPRVKAADLSDVLLEVTPVREAGDVHEVVQKIQERAAAILSHELGLEASATMGFAMALSEACQNIVEHAGTSGWVAVQTYNWKKRLGRKVVIIAVADTGVGFTESLETTQSTRFGDRWGASSALEAALIHGTSRFPDPGRGQGLQGIRKYLKRWSGKLSVRSDTARITFSPDWDSDVPMADHLPYFPGAQVLMIIPGANQENA